MLLTTIRSRFVLVSKPGDSGQIPLSATPSPREQAILKSKSGAVLFQRFYVHIDSDTRCLWHDVVAIFPGKGLWYYFVEEAPAFVNAFLD